MEWHAYAVEELQEIAAAVGERSGWDFSRMVTEREPVPWDYQDIVTRYLTAADIVLDIGTGGGERLLSLAPHVRQALGVDPDPVMIATATANGAGIPGVTFRQMSAEALDLPDDSFDVVLTRHAPVYIPELDRVIRPGGRFICQGVGGRNMANIREAFGTGSASRNDEKFIRDVNDLTSRGWHVLVTGMYDVAYWVKDVASLLFWFGAIAGANPVPADFSIERHGVVINRLIADHVGSSGLATNEHRTLLVARKPVN